MKNKFLEIIKRKWLRSVVLTIILFTIIACSYMGIYYGMSLVHIDAWDFTKEKIYSITQATRDKLQNIDEDVTIYIYNMYKYVEDFAYQYANLDEHIKVEVVDNLNTHLEWKSKYGVTDSDAFIVMQTEDKERLLFDENFYTYDYTTYEQVDITEEAMTNAILDVITEQAPKICFLEGHNVYPTIYFQYIKNALYTEVNEIEELDLLVSGSIPDECKLLVITAVSEDITQKEKDLILDYIKKGGEILFLLDSNVDQIKTPNFNKILEEYGVSISDGIILEADGNKMISGAPNFIISTINPNSEIVKNINMDLNLCLINAGKLSIASEEELEKKNVTVETLATVSDKAFYRKNLKEESLERVDSDEDAAEAPIAAMFTKENKDGNNSKMIIFSSTSFATNLEMQLDSDYSIHAIEAYNNQDILLNTVSYLTEREDNITIRKTGETVTTYDMNANQMRIVLGIIFGIPVFIIFVGILVWQIRRRK